MSSSSYHPAWVLLVAMLAANFVVAAQAFVSAVVVPAGALSGAGLQGEALVDVVLAVDAGVACAGAVAPVAVDQVAATAAVEARRRRALVNVGLAVATGVTGLALAFVGLKRV